MTKNDSHCISLFFYQSLPSEKDILQQIFVKFSPIQVYMNTISIKYKRKLNKNDGSLTDKGANKWMDEQTKKNDDLLQFPCKGTDKGICKLTDRQTES